jgi:hypothetical protein
MPQDVMRSQAGLTCSGIVSGPQYSLLLLNSGLIFLGMSSSPWTHKEAASNPEGFTFHRDRIHPRL